ncbi:hypothetical protein CSUI_007142, partial [Cystoisospora suis]
DIQARNLLESLLKWVASGDLKLSAEDKRGTLGQILARDCPRDGLPSEATPPPPLQETDRFVAGDVDRPADQVPSADPAPKAEERKLWLGVLEAEEGERLKSLRASIDAFQAHEMPTRFDINRLLVSALQAQITLLRMSRVFPASAARGGLNLTSAASHGPTMELARELRLCWRALGVTDFTLTALLRHALPAAGQRTSISRGELFAGVLPRLRRGVDPKALKALATEGSVFAADIQTWNLLRSVRKWIASGDLTLSSEDEQGRLGQLLATDWTRPPGSRMPPRT